MTIYLLDENVLNQLKATGNANVRKWLALAATATVKNFVLVTRNIADVRHTRARLLDPYRDPPEWFEPEERSQ